MFNREVNTSTGINIWLRLPRGSNMCINKYQIYLPFIAKSHALLLMPGLHSQAPLIVSHTNVVDPPGSHPQSVQS